MEKIAVLYHYLQLHPLYWQVTVSLLTTSGAFEILKRKIVSEDKKHKKLIATLISTVGALEVLIHGAIVGLTFVSTFAAFKAYAVQILFFLGALNLVYNFLVTSVTNFLKRAKELALAQQKTVATPPQITQTPASAGSQDVGGGVVDF